MCMPWVCSINIYNLWMTLNCGKNIIDTHCHRLGANFLFLPHFDIIFDQYNVTEQMHSNMESIR